MSAPRVPDLPEKTGGPPERTRTDPCHSCHICDEVCPVTPVNADFQGPKSQGPQEWRLRDGGVSVDHSIAACTNCLQCHAACPADVDLMALHTEARAEHVEERGWSLHALRDRLLANYGLLARLGSRVPRLANWAMDNRWLRSLAESVLGITAEREAPEFANETFREWWADRGGPQVESETKRVAYFHGDHANYHQPAVGKSLVRVYEHLGYEVRVPEQRCSGAPMVANGHLEDAERVTRKNVESFDPYIEAGYDVIATCTSCSLTLRETNPREFDVDGVDRLAANTYDAVEYLRMQDELADLELDSAALPDALSYHAPCHARDQGVDGAALPALRAAGVEVAHLGDDCSGMSGTYGWKEERYEDSMAIGEDLFAAAEAVEAEASLTECPTCGMQLEHGTQEETVHPIEVLSTGLDGRRNV
ncbi:anaerobic glycerol-3-phosphate dehydrogenase subunit C [Halodesulfurarchaeum formicicum]|uniref:anaerobic glycerol-3-phosphate dehydrogenase subunit C n=1 Tax=Halodesulfurarchaeum formicicum TaxID=1873524 RepID=UPI0009F2112D|nr:anaerobic glycerol-3-phosphate dehydrogenase subunit C [Halodesulfurarchaeum formicicum]